MSTPTWKHLRRQGLELAAKRGGLVIGDGADRIAARALVATGTDRKANLCRRGRKADRTTGRASFLAAIDHARAEKAQAQTDAAVMLMLVFREKTGCRQYVFRDAESFISWAGRKPYSAETIHWKLFGPDRRLVRECPPLPASESVEVFKAGWPVTVVAVS